MSINYILNGSFHIHNLQTIGHQFSRGGQGHGNPGVMGAGGLWEAGEEKAGDSISQGAGAGRNRK